MVIAIGSLLLLVFVFGAFVGSFIRALLVKKTLKKSVEEACTMAMQEQFIQAAKARRDLAVVLGDARLALLRCAYLSKKSADIDWRSFYETADFFRSAADSLRATSDKILEDNNLTIDDDTLSTTF